jgi:small-conductance mechanosensitive channel
MNITVWGNPLWRYGLSGALLAGGLLFLWAFVGFLNYRMKKGKAGGPPLWGSFFIVTLKRTAVPLGVFLIFRASVQNLETPKVVDHSLDVAGKVLFTFLAARLLLGLVRYLLIEAWAKKFPDGSLERQLRGFMPIVTALVWVGALLFLLDNLGFKITTVMAGLGIGGVAVALASQAVLADFFSYLAILFDKPFEVGDFIILGDFMGTVEHVGIKTTRIRSLGGEQLVFSNVDLTSSRLKNYKRMELRRVPFQLGVTYDTSLEKLKAIPRWIKEIIEKTPGARFDRAHFAAFGDFSLTLETVYYVLSADYNVYMDTQQQINFAIKEVFEREGVEFAYPTQTVLVRSGATPSAEVPPRPI